MKIRPVKKEDEMDLTGFVDQFNEITYYVESKKDELYQLNYARLMKISRWLAGAYLFVFLFYSFYVDRFHASPFDFAALIFMFASIKAFSKMKERLCVSFERVRLVSIIYFMVAAFILLFFDMRVHANTYACFFAISFWVIPVLYVDVPQVFLVMEMIMIGAYAVMAYILHRNIGLVGEDLSLLVLVGILSMLCYWQILSAMTEGGREERALKEVGAVDLLTGLLNKVSFEREASAYLGSRMNPDEGALLIIDFDNFKNVNDKFGHLTGDAILQKFGKILVKNFREGDIIGRVGGDEFMVMMTGEITDEIIKKHCDIIQHDLYVSRVGEAGGFSCSIGVAVDHAGYKFNEIYRLADDALYEAKARGKARYVEWHSEPICIPDKKIIYIASPDRKMRDLIRTSVTGDYVYMESDNASKALNEISIYQEYLESVFFDYVMPDMDEAVLHKYMNSRPVFSQIPIHDIAKEL